MRKKLCALTVIVCILAALTACGKSPGSSGDGTLRVGVRNNIMNFGYLNENTGNYYGLEIDLASELASRMGYKDVEFTSVLPENREEILEKGDVDCLVACFTITDDRKAQFDFSPSYYEDYVAMMVQKSSMLSDLKSLRGKKIGVREGSNGESSFTAKMKEKGYVSSESEINFVPFDTYDAMSVALEEGSVDVVIMDGCITHAYMNDDRLILDEKLDEGGYGVTTVKGSPLSGEIAEAVQSMLDDGTVSALTDKWD